MRTEAYYTYRSLMLKLHFLIVTGKGDSEEADALRDQMDKPWEQMTDSDRTKSRNDTALMATGFEDRKRVQLHRKYEQ